MVNGRRCCSVSGPVRIPKPGRNTGSDPTPTVSFAAANAGLSFHRAWHQPCTLHPQLRMTESDARVSEAVVLRALVADDDPEMRDLVASLLRREGFLVREATNGAELLSLATDGPQAHLVITDLQMPGINGLEVLSRMQKEHPRVPVILMTAFANARVREQALQGGAVAVLAKPFSIVELDKLVAQHVIKG